VAPPSSPSGLAVSDGVLLLGRNIMPSYGWEGYNPTGSLLTAYDAASGRALWHDNADHAGISWDLTPIVSPLTASGAVYLLGIESDPYVQDPCVLFCRGVSWVYAVNLHTGAPWWRARMGYANLTHWVL
jgi:outer membrane protein assembly factor BamB